MVNDLAQWEAGNIRGVGTQRVYLGTQTNAEGQQENIYEIRDSEWGTPETTAYEFQYINWHQTYHVRQNVKDTRQCRICLAEWQFEQQQLPHIQQHRQRGIYIESCRFCQDDRFFGRM